MMHNATSGELSVWWDSKISAVGWHYGAGSYNGSTVSLLIPDYSKTPIVGNMDESVDLITWIGGAGTWHRHPSSCLSDVAACADKDLEGCPARNLNNPYSDVLTCPTDEAIAMFTQAAQRGDIAWHAGPFNWQPENMAPALFDAGIDLVRRMDARFYTGGKVSSCAPPNSCPPYQCAHTILVPTCLLICYTQFALPAL
jgi:hypothetical protein